LRKAREREERQVAERENEEKKRKRKANTAKERQRKSRKDAERWRKIAQKERRRRSLSKNKGEIPLDKPKERKKKKTQAGPAKKKSTPNSRDQVTIDLTDMTLCYMGQVRVLSQRPLHSDVPGEPQASVLLLAKMLTPDALNTVMCSSSSDVTDPPSCR